MKKIFSFSGAEIILFLEAAAVLYAAKIQLLMRPFKQVRLWAEKSAARSQAPQTSARIQTAHDVRTAVRRAQKLICWKQSLCLVNALAAQRMLARRGLSSTLHLGVNKPEGRLEAHAWLECEGVGVAGTQIKNRFTPVAAFHSSIHGTAHSIAP